MLHNETELGHLDFPIAKNYISSYKKTDLETFTTDFNTTMWTLKVLSFFIFAGVIRAQDEVTVDTMAGSVKGLKVTTNFNGKPYFSFRGIPYARPPVGPYKFDVSF